MNLRRLAYNPIDNIQRDYISTWTTIKNEKKFVYQMDSDHIKNCISLLKRRMSTVDENYKNHYTNLIKIFQNELNYRRANVE